MDSARRSSNVFGASGRRPEVGRRRTRAVPTEIETTRQPPMMVRSATSSSGSASRGSWSAPTPQRFGGTGGCAGRSQQRGRGRGAALRLRERPLARDRRGDDTVSFRPSVGADPAPCGEPRCRPACGTKPTEPVTPTARRRRAQPAARRSSRAASPRPRQRGRTPARRPRRSAPRPP